MQNRADGLADSDTISAVRRFGPRPECRFSTTQPSEDSLSRLAAKGRCVRSSLVLVTTGVHRLRAHWSASSKS